jgi:hypothetical protein
VLSDQRLQLTDQLGVGAERKPGLDQLLPRRHAQLVEPGDLALRERLIGEVRQRRPAPQRQRHLKRRRGALGAARGEFAPPLCEEPLEAMRVEALRIEPQLVAVLPCRDRRGRTVALPARERLAQPGDVHLHRLGGAGRRTLPPQLVDQPIGTKRLIGMQHKQGQQRTLPAAAQPDHPTPVKGLERAKNAEVHASSESGSQ